MNDTSKKEGIHFVICKICNFHARKISCHIPDVHKISVKEYIEKFNSKTICDDSVEVYRELGKTVGIKALEKMRRQPGHREKMSKSLSKAILNNPKERARRSALMKQIVEKNKKNPEYIKLLSENAKKTSARKDVQEARAKRLQKWRDENPDDFYNKCTAKMLEWVKNNPEDVKKRTEAFIMSYDSNPEKILFSFLSKIEGFSFKRNQFIYSKKFQTKSNKKQIDIADKTKKIYIEFDGPTHFQPVFGEEKLKYTKDMDCALEEHIMANKWTLIRVSLDQYVRKGKKENCFFLQECLDRLCSILSDAQPGIYKIGEKYNE